MDLGPHAGFILAAYGFAALVVAVLIARAFLDHRTQRRALADLERRGAGRGAGGRGGGSGGGRVGGRP